MRASCASLSLAAGFLMLVNCGSAQDAGLPPETTFNSTAGRGDLIWINLRSDTAQDYLFGVDTGATLTVLDKSWERKLQPAHPKTVVGARWAVSGIFVTPPLLLGGVQLHTGDTVVTEDLAAHFPGRTVAGLLGMDCLGHYCLQFDFAENKLRFLDPNAVSAQDLGKVFPIEPLRGCFFVNDNLAGIQGFNSLIDTGCNFDGVLVPSLFRQWTNQWQSGAPVPADEARYPNGIFGGIAYTNLYLAGDGERDLIGLHLLARNIVTLNFPGRTMYLQQQTPGPLPAETNYFAHFYKSAFRTH
jgi:hypothetical protein